MDIQKVIVGQLDVNCYMAKEGKECFVVDPGDEPDKILRQIDKFELKFILLTHCHFDHTLALTALNDNFPDAAIYVTEEDEELLRSLSEQEPYSGYPLKDFALPVNNIEDEDIIEFRKHKIKVISTPGHSFGSVCYFMNGILFTGDTLFYHTIGRTDFWTSDKLAMKTSLEKLAKLPKTTKVYPGHGPETTIAEELQNGFLG